MKLYFVGLISSVGKRAYMKDMPSESLTMDKKRADLFGLDAAARARNWLAFNFPNCETFMEPMEADGVVGSAPANCPACDAGHCGKHI